MCKDPQFLFIFVPFGLSFKNLESFTSNPKIPKAVELAAPLARSKTTFNLEALVRFIVFFT